MAEQGEVRVRNVTTKRNDGIVGSVMDLGSGAVKLGMTVVFLPLTLLPKDTRTHVRNAVRELAYALATLPRDLATVAGDAVDDWAKETDGAPRDEIAPAK